MNNQKTKKKKKIHVREKKHNMLNGMLSRCCDLFFFSLYLKFPFYRIEFNKKKKKKNHN